MELSKEPQIVEKMREQRYMGWRQATYTTKENSGIYESKKVLKEPTSKSGSVGSSSSLD